MEQKYTLLDYNFSPCETNHIHISKCRDASTGKSECCYRRRGTYLIDMKSSNIRLKTSRLIIFIYPRLLVYMIKRPSFPVSLCCSLIAHRKISLKTIRWKPAFLWKQYVMRGVCVSDARGRCTLPSLCPVEGKENKLRCVEWVTVILEEERKPSCHEFVAVALVLTCSARVLVSRDRCTLARRPRRRQCTLPPRPIPVEGRK
jgi:hypothetical protein